MWWVVLCLPQLVAGGALDSGRYMIDSKPLLFVDEPTIESQIINSSIILKKKPYTGGPVFYNKPKPEPNPIINNHYSLSGKGNVWRKPQAPITEVISNHKKDQSKTTNKWFQKPLTSTDSWYLKPPISNHKGTTSINNHKSNKYQPSSVVTVTDAPAILTSVLGSRLKQPDTIKSTAIKVLDAPHGTRTTLKHGKIIVIQKRIDPVPGPVTSQAVTEDSYHVKKNFSVAPVMDPWSNIPIPSKPSWASSSKPVKGQAVATPATSTQTVFPHLPFMPFLSSILMPLLSKPLSPTAFDTGMKGIKAMQGFLRNSLLGAMLCFLPSAFIALTLTATQGREQRDIQELDDMVVLCKKCLEKLKQVSSKELT